jgi:hypothetical protein
LSWGHRIRQFAWRLAATRPPEDVLAQQLLPDAALALFKRMSAGDQQHSVQVLLALRKSGAWGSEVEQAALLHDVAKSQARLTLTHRVAVVLLGTLAPRLLERLAAPDAPPWRYPFYVHVRHAEIGAALCAQAGCSPVTVALVRAHQDYGTDVLPPELHAALAALRQADEHC